VPRAKKIVNLVDLCGHEKYLKTTIVGMVGMVPEYTLIVVGANAGLSKMTKEHLGIALALEIPFFIVITKIDMVDKETLKKTIFEIKKIMKASFVNKKPFLI
jgi:GTPase